MRTDSTRCSAGAIEALRGWLARAFPAELPEAPRLHAPEGRAQDAHEAIRPTMVDRLPDGLKEVLTKDQAKLYALIWERFVASQMTAAKKRTTAVGLAAETPSGPALFRGDATRLVEPGFYKVVRLSATKDEKREGSLPELRQGEVLKARALRPEQRFTRGPLRYTDASIIQALDEEGIGRPSTYAPIISVLLERFYVTREGGELRPSTLGTMISGILVESFPDLIDAGFTARIEAQLDEVEEARADWVEMIRGFYAPFKRRVDEVMEGLKSYKGTLDEATDRVCEKCGLPMVKRLGRHGFFLACTGFPACKTTASLPLAPCPRCGTGEIVAKRKAAGRSREFYGCSRYPTCDFVSFYKPTASSCPKCGQFLVERFDKKRGSYKSCINPLCDQHRGREGGA
jgi:DNA topoisomerase-1